MQSLLCASLALRYTLQRSSGQFTEVDEHALNHLPPYLPLSVPQYIDPIVQATFNQDGALQEIVRTLSTRLRDSNTTVRCPSPR